MSYGLDVMKSKLIAMGGGGVNRKRRNVEPEISAAHVARSKLGKMKRRKGSTFERKVAKMFAAWTGDQVRRTPLSGGWAGAAFGVKGDLVFSKVDSLHVECKNHEGWYLEDLIKAVRKRGTTSIMAWWDQCCGEAPKGREPHLVFSRNGLHPLLVIRKPHMFSTTEAGFVQFCPMFEFYMEGTKHGDGPVVIMSLSDYFKKCRPPKKSPHRRTWIDEQK